MAPRSHGPHRHHYRQIYIYRIIATFGVLQIRDLDRLFYCRPHRGQRAATALACTLRLKGLEQARLFQLGQLLLVLLKLFPQRDQFYMMEGLVDCWH